MIEPGMLIDYKMIMSEIDSASYDEAIEHFCEIVLDVWIDDYKQCVKNVTNIISFDDNGFTFLFDDTSELARKGIMTEEENADGRVVAVYGRSKAPELKRDVSRMKGFLGGFRKLFKHVSYDKGHFIGHSLGGGLDVNLFPQRSDINRGWSKKGKIYRAMEKYCSRNPGTFCFSRPIYDDKSWVPCAIEYGVLLSVKDVWVEVFENR